jgi:hypothetical protein
LTGLVVHHSSRCFAGCSLEEIPVPPALVVSLLIGIVEPVVVIPFVVVEPPIPRLFVVPFVALKSIVTSSGLIGVVVLTVFVVVLLV